MSTTKKPKDTEAQPEPGVIDVAKVRAIAQGTVRALGVDPGIPMADALRELSLLLTMQTAVQPGAPPADLKKWISLWEVLGKDNRAERKLVATEEATTPAAPLSTQQLQEAYDVAFGITKSED